MGFPSHAIGVEQAFWQTRQTTNGFGGSIFHSTSPSASAPSTAPPGALTSVCVWGEKSCTANPSQGQQERGRRRQDLGFRDLSELRESLLSSHLQGLNSGRASSPPPAVCQPLEHWDKAGEVLKQPLRWLKRARKNLLLHLCPLSSITGWLSTFLSDKSPRSAMY